MKELIFMDKYLLTAHDVRGEWRDIENIIKNTNGCNLIEVTCDIANSPNMGYGLYVYHFLMETTKETFHAIVNEVSKLPMFDKVIA